MPGYRRNIPSCLLPLDSMMRGKSHDHFNRSSLASPSAEKTFWLRRLPALSRRDYPRCSGQPGRHGVASTGGGKSLCFQLPALLRNGLCVVVSPLISLMKDQVDALKANGLPATLLNSSLSLEETRLRLAELREGQV